MDLLHVGTSAAVIEFELIIKIVSRGNRPLIGYESFTLPYTLIVKHTWLVCGVPSAKGDMN